MFGNKKEKEKELGTKVAIWWRELKYLEKLEVLLACGKKSDGYQTYDITALEYIGVRTFWGYKNLEQKAKIMENWEKEKEHKKERR